MRGLIAPLAIGLAALRWPAPDLAEIEHVHDALDEDQPHLADAQPATEGQRYRRAFVIDSHRTESRVRREPCNTAIMQTERLSQNDLIFSPDGWSINRSQLTAFINHCERGLGRSFKNYESFAEFSVADYPSFWRLFLTWSEVAHNGDAEPPCVGLQCEDAAFFPNIQLNYAEALLGDESQLDRPAVTACHASENPERFSRRELRQKVARLAQSLENMGVRTGDRVALIGRNNAESVIVALATASIGAILSSCSAEMGAFAVLSRFAPLEPVVLMTACRTEPWDTGPPVADRAAEIAQQLSSLKAIVTLDDGKLPDGLSPRVTRIADIISDPGLDVEQPVRRYPFNTPLFILFSSGTTGAPKCIVHGAGGTLLEHLKEHRLHCDLRAGDRLYFQTSCAWMMWNWSLTALASGVELVLYDGPVQGPETLWGVVDAQAVTVFGTSPAYLHLCEKTGFVPRETFALSSLRSILSTGSILQARQFDWVRDNVKPMPVQSISGGTDIIGCFMLGNPVLPTYRGELQCRSLAMDVRALPPTDDPDARIGELICANPFPSRPLGFFGDDGTRFHAAYFAQNAAVWTHGDRVEFTPRGGAIMHGRSDGILNVNGIRVGPAEVYRILEDIDEIVEAMAVEQALDGEASASRMILLVVLREGIVLDDTLVVRIRSTLAKKGSAALVPARIAQVDELPTTHSGKRSEAAARSAVNGQPVRNRDALRNPASLDAIGQHPMLQQADRSVCTSGGGVPADREALQTELQRICAEALGLSSIGRSDHFFELGADSLAIVTMQLAIEEQLGRRLPIMTLFRTPTVSSLADQILRSPADGAIGDDIDGAEGPIVRKAEPDDVDAICGLLSEGFAASGVAAAEWHVLFEYAWLTEKPDFGFVAVDDDAIVGFIGTIYSDRVIGGQTVRVCNLTSWFVASAYRGLAITLLEAALRDGSVAFTALTPIPVTRRVLDTMGFQNLVSHKTLFPPLANAKTLLGGSPDILVGPDQIEQVLSTEHRKLLNDHLHQKLLHVVVRDATGYCYLIVKRRRRHGRVHERLPVAVSVHYSDVLYCSAPALFARYFERIKIAILLRQKTIALVVDEFMLPPNGPRGVVFPGQTMYRAASVRPQDLDKLYSELVILPI